MLLVNGQGNGKLSDIMARFGVPTAVAFMVLGMLSWGGRFLLVDMRESINRGFERLTIAMQQNSERLDRINTMLSAHLEQDRYRR